MDYAMAMNKKGFTILESIIVLGIIALIFGMSIPQFLKFTRGSTINSAAYQVANVLKTARSYAISRNSNYEVNFDSTTFPSGPHAIWITDSAVPTPNVAGKRYMLPKTISIGKPDGSNPVTFMNGRATFKPTGGIVGNNGSVSLMDKNSATKCISVINTTGRVKID
ncbi:MAG: GspH/FimT family pseudopilin [Candidatus Omnitrophota bacterium]